MENKTHSVHPALTRTQVRAFDRWAIEEIHIPGAVLMENAGRSCAECICTHYGPKGPIQAVIVCGTGNNGGDGFVIARHLLNQGHTARVLLCGEPSKMKGDAQLYLEVWERINGSMAVWDHETASLTEHLASGNLVVDALFGTGLQGIPRFPYPMVIQAINQSPHPVVAVDIPSGLDCDTGLPWGDAVRADRTVTFVALKQGFQADSAKEYTGHVIVAGIGIEPVQWPARPS